MRFPGTRLSMIGAVLALALVIPALTAAPAARAQVGGGATGTVIPNMVTVQGLVVDDTARAGQYDYLIDVTASSAVGDYRPAAEAEQTYIAVDATTNQVIDSGTTDANGVAVLNGEIGAPFYVYEAGDQNNPFGTTNLTYPADQTDATVFITGLQYVAGSAPEPAVTPTVAPSDSAAPLPTGVASGTVVANQITIQGIVFADPSRAGQVGYSRDATQASALGNYRLAREGEQTYTVYDLNTNGVIDQGSTGPDGTVALDGETGASFYVVESDDAGAIPGTDTLFVPSDAPDPSVMLYGIVYVSAIDAAPTTEPTVAPTDVPTDVPTETPVAPVVDTPTTAPTEVPTAVGTGIPTGEPTIAATDVATDVPTDTPTVPASDTPTAAPPVAGTTDDDGTGRSGDGMAITPDSAASGAASEVTTARPAAPIQTDRTGVSTLPNTGTGGAQTAPRNVAVVPVSATLMALAVMLVVVLGARRFGRRVPDGIPVSGRRGSSAAETPPPDRRS